MGKIEIPLVLTMTLMIIAIVPHNAFGEPVIVDLQLQQLVDISASVEETPDGEFSLQRDAWAFAFSSDDVKAAIADPNFNGMCIQFIYWSGSTQQEIVVDWKLVNDAASAEEVSDTITNFPRPFDDGGTQIDDAILFGIAQLDDQTAECQGITKIMDISGDGEGPVNTSAARDAALAAGIDAINGLAIQAANVQTFYENNVQGGDESFTLFASTFNALAGAAEQKILDEIMFAINNNKVIGGEIIPINTVSLLVAGLESMSIWMAPALAGVAGAAVLYLKSRKN